MVVAMCHVTIVCMSVETYLSPKDSKKPKGLCQITLQCISTLLLSLYIHTASKNEPHFVCSNFKIYGLILIIVGSKKP